VIHIIIPKYEAPPAKFGDDGEDAAHQREIAAAREHPRYQVQVMPRCGMQSLKRGWLEAGAEVRSSDLEGGEPALLELVRRRVLLQVAPDEVLPSDTSGATHRVSKGHAVLSKTRGVLVEGTALGAADLAEAAVEAQPEVPSALRLDGMVQQGRPAVPGRPGNDGRAALEDLVRRGVLEPIATSSTPSRKTAA